MTNLYIDMDSTMVDYVRQYSKFHYRETGEKVIPTDEQLSQYLFNSIYGVSDENKYDYLTVEFFSTVEFYKSAKSVINELNSSKMFNIYFVSHMVTQHAYQGKVIFLNKHFDWFEFDKHLIAMKDKHLLESGIIIDDNPEVIKNSLGKHGEVICFNQPWNIESPCDKRFHSWSEIRNYFLG